MKDTINSVLEALRSRVGNPIIGSFICSWIAINWRFIYYMVFSKADVLDKFKHIDNKYIVNTPDFLFKPLIAAAVLVTVTKFINIKYSEFSEWINFQINSNKIEKDTDITLKKKKLIEATTANELIDLKVRRDHQELDLHDERERLLKGEEERVNKLHKEYKSNSSKLENDKININRQFEDIKNQKKQLEDRSKVLETDAQHNKDFRAELDTEKQTFQIKETDAIVNLRGIYISTNEKLSDLDTKILKIENVLFSKKLSENIEAGIPFNVEDSQMSKEKLTNTYRLLNSLSTDINHLFESIKQQIDSIEQTGLEKEQDENWKNTKL